MLNVAYQVLAVYKCNICKENHQISLGLPNLLPDSGARMAEMADIKIRVYDGIKKMFVNIHAPTDKFNLKRLTITEIDDKGKSRKVKITDIEQLLKGGLTEIEKLEAKRGSSPEIPEKIVSGTIKVVKESPIEKEEETPFQDTGKKEGMSFDEIRDKVNIRIKELQEMSKRCREAMEELGIQLKKTKAEMASLQSLIKAIDQPKGKKNGRKQKQKSKSK